jgi:DNA ligase-1
MLFKELFEYYNRIKKVGARNKKIDIICEFLGKIKKQEAEIGVNLISGNLRQGKLNIAWKGLSELIELASTSKKSPSLLEIDHYLEQTKSAKGKHKLKILQPLFKRLTSSEKHYLVSLILNDLRQGAGEGLVKMAIARVFGLQDNEIEQVYLHYPDLGKLYVHLLKKGRTGIKDVGIKIFRPVKPMLAQVSESIEDIIKENDAFAVEYKLDGVRIQVHRKGDKIRIFSRNLKDITSHFPELVRSVKNFPVKSFILDGEAIGIDKHGRALPFQILAQRTTRKKDIDKMMKSVPVVPKFFDILYVDEEDLTSIKYIERSYILDDIVRDKACRAEKDRLKNKSDAKRFFNRSLEQGNEGIMIKLLDSPYRPGKRGKFWYKIKKVYTVDCVILAAEWGHGRRRGFLSNLHLGVLNETRTKFLMVGKTFKGLTDKMLKWLTDNLPKYKVHEGSWTLYLKPKVVVEIALN